MMKLKYKSPSKINMTKDLIHSQNLFQNKKVNIKVNLKAKKRIKKL